MSSAERVQTDPTAEVEDYLLYLLKLSRTGELTALTIAGSLNNDQEVIFRTVGAATAVVQLGALRMAEHDIVGRALGNINHVQSRH